MKKVLVFLADGFEEVEAITPIDYLRRAGIDVVTVAIGPDRTVCGSHKIPVCADAVVSEINPDEARAIVLPGGMPGSANLAESKELDAIIRSFDKEKKLICAICAAPALVLATKGVLDGRDFTCFPGAKDGVPTEKIGARYSTDSVVCCGHVITSRGAGTAGSFACAIISELCGKDAADKIASQTLMI